MRLSSLQPSSRAFFEGNAHARGYECVSGGRFLTSHREQPNVDLDPPVMILDQISADSVRLTRAVRDGTVGEIRNYAKGGSSKSEEETEEDEHDKRRVCELLQPQGIDYAFGEPASPATKRLFRKVILRSLTAAEDVAKLLAEGATAWNSYIYFIYPGPVRVSVLQLVIVQLAIDDPTDCRDDPRQFPLEEAKCLQLPNWPSPQVQTAVLDGMLTSEKHLIHRGALTRLLRFPVDLANPAAMRCLLKHYDGTLTGQQLVYLPRNPLPLRMTDDYGRALLDVYRCLLDREPSLACEETGTRCNAFHMAAVRGDIVSKDFLHTYLDMLKDHGGNIRGLDLDQATPVHAAAAYQNSP
ncbi:unnamed protein product [Vitrella brassicaformis CCMP3155]|uniref:Uncharacterized protein n=1 Tax=Vitrella brassicaformis (strain CCMP3155) TaxID=1169540 RepID=A0A0G4EQG4_VITBC|nr:unnamed protein product [Vitrella brassicaformis CCMP3155]|eukprot:CEL99679.1 unnamed protein product [Vitrella brassicaformis CCMP3155]